MLVGIDECISSNCIYSFLFILELHTKRDALKKIKGVAYKQFGVKKNSIILSFQNDYIVRQHNKKC